MGDCLAAKEGRKDGGRQVEERQAEAEREHLVGDKKKRRQEKKQKKQGLGVEWEWSGIRTQDFTGDLAAGTPSLLFCLLSLSLLFPICVCLSLSSLSVPCHVMSCVYVSISVSSCLSPFPLLFYYVLLICSAISPSH